MILHEQNGHYSIKEKCLYTVYPIYMHECTSRQWCERGGRYIQLQVWALFGLCFYLFDQLVYVRRCCPIHSQRCCTRYTGPFQLFEMHYIGPGQNHANGLSIADVILHRATIGRLDGIRFQLLFALRISLELAGSLVDQRFELLHRRCLLWIRQIARFGRSQQLLLELVV